ncbi:Uncharacterized protein Rs2_04917 [Raphanus sativus]|nr:Uncharacterized protein Rs2_04917 [Raphanus sativus]
MTLSDSQKTLGDSAVSSGQNSSVDQAVVTSGVVNSEKREGALVAPSALVKAIGQKTLGDSAVSSGQNISVDQTVVTSGVVNSEKREGALVAPSAPVKPIGNTGGSSGIRIGGRGKTYVSRGAKGKGIALDSDREVLAFKDAKIGPHEGEVQFRLIHFWEAWNTVTNMLIGIEMLLIDREII